MRRRTGSHDRDRGAAALEMALVIGIFLVLVFGIIDFGRWVFAKSEVNSAARESARSGIVVGQTANGVEAYRDCNAIVAAGVDRSVHLVPENFAVTLESEVDEENKILTCGPDKQFDAQDIGAEALLTVTVSDDFVWVTPFLSSLIGDVTVSSTDKRSLVYL